MGTLVFAAAFLAAPKISAQVVTFNQSFTGTSAPGWTLGGTGYTPVLTAAQGIDSSGSGWLRLTSNAGNESTFAYNPTAFNGANATIAVQFSYASYNGSGADGITFFLADASKPFAVGAYGGSLGYAQKTAAGGGGADINGMNGGYVGVGIDEFGNYSNPTEGRVGGVGSVPNAIAVRGPGQGLTGYNYLGGTGNLGANSIAFPGSTTRPTGANARTVEITLTATNQMTVYLESGTSGTFAPLYSIDLSGYARPDQLVLGFTGSTGGSTDIHEIQNVALTSVAANLWSNAANTSTWGTTAANWTGTSAPATGADVLLDNTYVNGAQTIDVGTGQTRLVRSLQIDAPFSYTLDNGTLEFNNNGVLGPSGILVSQTHGSAVQTVNSNLIADNAIEIKNGSSGALNLTGTLATNGNAVTVDGTGNTAMSGVISGTGSLVKNDGGGLTLSGANTFSGGTTLNTGTLTANNNNALGTGAVAINGGTLASTNGSTVGNAIALQASAGFSGITTSGTLTQTGGSYTLNMANATQSGAVNLSDSSTGRTLTTEVDSGTSTISGVITNGGSGAGAGSLTKTGAGTLDLSGHNTYTGTTTINAGTVQLGASNVLSNTSSLNIAGGTLNLNGNSDKVGALSFSNGGTLDFGTGTNSFVFGNISSNSGILTINNYTDGPNYLGSTTAGIAAAALNSIYFSGFGSGTVEATATSNAGNGLGNAYKITTSTTFLTWSGGSAGSNNWSSGANWQGGTAPSTSTNSKQKLDFTGTTRLGPVMDNSYYVNALKFDSAAGAFNINESGNTLTLQGTLPSIIQQSASNQTISGGTVAFGANSVIDVNGAGSLTISSVLSGTGNLTKLSGGTLALSGANSGYSGAIGVNAGILSVSGNDSVLGTGGTTVQSGGTLQITDGRSLSNAITLNGSGAGGIGALDAKPGTGNTAKLSHSITLGSDSAIAVDSGTLSLTGGITGTNTDLTLNNAGALALSSAIATGTGSVTLNGTGTTTFSGAANTYTGDTTVNGGTLNLSKNANVTAVAGNLTINGGAVNETASGQIASTATVTLNSGAFALGANAAQTLTEFDSSSGSTTTLNNGSTLTINDTGNSVVNGTIAGAGSLVTSGTGSVTLGSSNSYSGGTTIGSVVTALNSSSLGTGTATINSGGNLQVQGGITLANSFTMNSPGTGANDGAVENVSGNNTISGAITLAGNSRLQSDSGMLTLSNTVGLSANTLNIGGLGNTTASGIISGAGSLTKDGTGTLTLSGANTYTGGTNINAGALVLGANNTLSSTGAVSVASGATLTLNNYAQTVGALSGAGTVQLGSGTLIVGNGGASSTFSGSFASGDTGIFEKTGAGTLTLGSNLSLSNGTLVLAGGTLSLNGTNSTFGYLSVTASSTLDFTGTSILNVLNSVSIVGGATLTIKDWVNGVDYFYSASNPGPTVLGQIGFTGDSPSATNWQSFDHEITPVPEPSSYGAVFMFLGLCGVAWRRLRGDRQASVPHLDVPSR